MIAWAGSAEALALDNGALESRAMRDGLGWEHGEPPGDLPAAGAGEQVAAFDVDAGVDERGGERSEKYFRVSETSAPARVVSVDVVELVDADQLDAGVRGGGANGVDDVGDVRPRGEGSPRNRANSAASIRGVAAGGTVM